MQLNALKLLLSLNDTHNMTYTAARYDMSQPAVSQQIHALEEELGFQLVRRVSKGIVLTPKAITILPYIQTIVDGYDELKTRAKLLSNDKEQLTIFYTGMIERQFIAKALALDSGGCMKHVQLLYGRFEDVREQLEHHKVDMVVTIDGVIPNGYPTYPLLNLQSCIISKNPLTDQGRVQLCQLMDSHIAILTADAAGLIKGSLAQLLIEHGVPAKNLITVDSLDSVMLLVDSGKAITILPKEGLVIGSVDQYHLYPIDDPHMRTHLICGIYEETPAIKRILRLFSKIDDLLE